MKIIISKSGKKIIAEFHHGKAVDKYTVDKAEDFLMAIDKFLTRYHTNGNGWKNVKLEFHNTGILTERVIRAIISGLSFDN